MGLNVERHRIKRNLYIALSLLTVSTIGLVLSINSWDELSGIDKSKRVHDHVQVRISINERPISIPAYVGIVKPGQKQNPLLYGDHSFDRYAIDGNSPLHTHDSTGIIHIESNTARSFTLGDFMKIWKGIPVQTKQTIAIVNGTPVSSFKDIVLMDREEINLDIEFLTEV